MRYCKKSTIVEAYLYREPLYEMGTLQKAPKFIVDARLCGRLFYGKNGDLKIKALERTVDLGDYIICRSDGELYSCKPDAFEKTYGQME